ncbi:SPW repeat protein [Chelatococcus sp. SYSU_G07232]|uniref:SPW repeat protein n=1 Tax=Chelatococcus albus TaxID=3047466 RepID=A0ABT7AL35_9HYPH|nr:SPW repeat protein [Chelatococcus sp. SYSU_G07232]MDJ1160092.1 SPW repeat protein [Chelatococcus sp. SYSU_G07232]
MATTLMEGRRPQDWVNLVLAACLFFSPWIVGFSGETMPAWNAWIVAVVFAVVTIAALSAFAEWEEWLNVVLGAWMIVSPWALGFASNMGALWTHVVLGVLTVAASGWAVWDYRHSPHATA